MSNIGPIPPEGSSPGVPPGQPSTPPPGPPLDSTGGTPGGPYVGPEPTKDDKTMAMLAHLLGILLGFIGPLIIWLIKKDQSPFVDDQGKEALNFQLTLLIGVVVGALTTCIFIGLIILPAVWICGLVFSIIAAMKANNGIAYRYPINIRFIK